MKHLLSILILLGFISVANAQYTIFSDFYEGESYNQLCNDLGGFNLINGCITPPDAMCMDAFNKPELCHTLAEKYDAYRYPIGGTVERDYNQISLHDIDYAVSQKEELAILIPILILGLIVFVYIVRFFIRRTKKVYQKSTIPLKNRVKRRELETRLNELDEVKPVEHTYKKTAYVDDTEEINEVKKLERQIKIKKLQKELKELEEE